MTIWSTPIGRNFSFIVSELVQVNPDNSLARYQLRSTVKRERFSCMFIFQTRQFSQTTVTIGPMKMFRLEHETVNVCFTVASISATLLKKIVKIENIIESRPTFLDPVP